ncbi:multiple monosaccharide ABC transporter permease [Fusibacter ferrireducens]|uniref:Xylose transport system permease protein XylH n=1 Tax=Fusibacter ferrireducens TaxID=2785058 RepID=A0ABR9ZX82_9FIRM|nr:multiple monosaccharide ABC transporter permease [Fusibacter ferrireducens]MBF4695069.1 sugar ABC transporter permease [Fusibacter ferrireducens]
MDRIKNIFKQNMKQYSMLIALIVIMAMFQILTGGILLKPINVSRLIFQNSYILILAIGMLLCILTGGNIDLSVGSIVAFVSALSALFSVTFGLPVWVSIPLGLLAGLVAGMWQGFWIAYVRIPPFIVTLAGMLLFRGINNIILGGQTVLLPEAYTVISSGVIPDFLGGSSNIHVTTLVIGVAFAIMYCVISFIIRKDKMKYDFEVATSSFFIAKLVAVSLIIVLFAYWLALANGLPFILILLGVLILIYSFLTNKTVVGRHIYAMGGNQKAAALSGIKTKRILFWVYANMGLLAAVAGIVFAGRLNSASPTAGDGFELDAIAACFIGGASATGGVGTIMGAIIGGFIMGILNNGMSIMGISVFWQQIVKGLVLLAAIAFDVYSKYKTKTAH